MRRPTYEPKSHSKSYASLTYVRVKIARRKKWTWIGIFKPTELHSSCDTCFLFLITRKLKVHGSWQVKLAEQHVKREECLLLPRPHFWQSYCEIKRYIFASRRSTNAVHPLLCASNAISDRTEVYLSGALVKTTKAFQFRRCGTGGSNRPQSMPLRRTNHRPPNSGCKKSRSAAGGLWCSSRRAQQQQRHISVVWEDIVIVVDWRLGV